MSVDNSVQDSGLVSDEKLRQKMRGLVHRAIHVDRTFSRTTLSHDSGVNIYTIDAILSRDEAKHRRIAMADALSIACVLGERAVNTILAEIGYGGARPLDEPEQMRPVQIVTSAMQQLGRIAKAAADDRIDHTEEQDTTEAADFLIAAVLPLSSMRKAS